LSHINDKGYVFKPVMAVFFAALSETLVERPYLNERIAFFLDHNNDEWEDEFKKVYYECKRLGIVRSCSDN